MKRKLKPKNFISYCKPSKLRKLSILAGMLFFFMLSSAIPVHAEEPDKNIEGSASDSSDETEPNTEDEKQEEETSNGDSNLQQTEANFGDGDIITKEKEAQPSDDANQEDNHTKNDEDTPTDDQKTETDNPDDELNDDSMKSKAEIIVEEAAKPAEENAEEKQITKLPMVDAPKIAPEGGEDEYNIFGVAGQYYVSVPKSMAFKKLANGDFETLQSSYYTVNSGLERGYKLSVRVSGVNDDETVQLANETATVHRKVEVSTMACDIWQYRPDGTVLTVNEADESGYGKELVLDGPGKFKAKCRLQRWEDDVLSAGTWSGSILFTVTCTPEPEEKDVSTADGQSAEEQQKPENSMPPQTTASPPEQQSEPPQEDTVTEPEGKEADLQGAAGTEAADVPAEFAEDETAVE